MKRKKPIRRVSKKRAAELKQYSALRKQFLAEFPLCYVYWSEEWVYEEAYELVCQRIRDGVCHNPCPSEEVHHKARRGKNYLNVDTWLAVSSRNHKRIEGQSTYDGKPYGMSWARENNFLL